MPVQFEYPPRAAADFPNWTFDNIDFHYDAASRSVWMCYGADAPPFYNFHTLSEIACVRDSLRLMFDSPQGPPLPIRYFVMASNKPGVFNLGGDLAMFAASIKAGDRDTLRAYAHACIDLVHGLATAFDLPIVTVSVVTGQALGGGLEGALAEDYLVADENAKLGVPEVAFNTFPGMGAITLLGRRLGAAKAEDIIASGRLYDGREMHELGVVDVLAPEGQAHATALAWMAEGGAERFARRLAIAAARRKFFPVSHEELVKITDLWVDCSCDVTSHDIRHMERLAAAQKRMFSAD